MGIFSSEVRLDKFKVKHLWKARIDEEVKYDLLMGSLGSANNKYEGYKRAAAQPGRSEHEIERAALEMSAWAKKRRSTLKQIREVQARTRIVDSLIIIIETKDRLKQHGLWAKLDKLSGPQLMKSVVKIATMQKEGEHKLDEISTALDQGVDDVVIEAERDTDEQKAIEEILALKGNLAT